MQRRCFILSVSVIGFLMVGSVADIGAANIRESSKSSPNILWLTCEDNNVDWVGCYGNPHAETPNIDRLAREGFQYMHAYASAPVCAPSRSTWITGINAISMGTHPMRSRYEIPHNLIQYYPDFLKANGYYVGNDVKTDYNIGGREDKACWDNPEDVDWNALKQNQPFFQVINSVESHESRAQGDVENTVHKPSDTRLRKYHPDLPDIRKNYAKYHDAIKRMDAEIGDSLKKLEEAGLADNTIVIYNSDHGGVMPRSKRYIFQTGLHCPLVIRIPEKYRHLWPAEQPGVKVDRLVSFVDMPKTWLSLTGSTVPDYMQGIVFLGSKAEPEPSFHFAFRGRMDERIENARAVCNKRFLYIRNYMPYVPWMQHLSYLWKMKAATAWDNYVKSGLATEVQARLFQPKGWTEELYDMKKDPDNVDNLIEAPELAAVVEELRNGLRGWQEKIYDAGMLPESEMTRRAKENNMTIYEMVRDPKLYNLPAYLDAADLALEANPASLPQLIQYLESDDSGIRYWGSVGCFLLKDRAVEAKPLLLKALSDRSHEVRAMAAWSLRNLGERKDCFDCLGALIDENSYAILTVLNVIDWMGDADPALLEKVVAIKSREEYIDGMRSEIMKNNKLDKVLTTSGKKNALRGGSKIKRTVKGNSTDSSNVK